MNRERPILFSGEMVRAILDGRKTQTRRVVKFYRHVPLGRLQEHIEWNAVYPAQDGSFIFWRHESSGLAEQTKKLYKGGGYKCPLGDIGDRLWVREAAYITPPCFASSEADYNIRDDRGEGRIIAYAATCSQTAASSARDYHIRLRPSIHMPRWASRITLEIQHVKVQRLQEMTDEDAEAEGFAYFGETLAEPIPMDKFINYWDQLNKRSGYTWERNPWVWVVDFKVLRP